MCPFTFKVNEDTHSFLHPFFFHISQNLSGQFLPQARGLYAPLSQASIENETALHAFKRGFAFCVLGSDWPSSQTFHSSGRRHRGFVYFHQTRLRTLKVLTKIMQVSEDMTGGNRPSGPSNKDMTKEMETSAEKCATQIPFVIEPVRCAHTGKVLQELCTVMCARGKCASAREQVGVVSTYLRRTHGCCYWLSAKVRFSNFWKKRLRTRLLSDFLVDGDNVELVVLSRLAPVS